MTLDAPDSIAPRSERVIIPGNQNVGRDEAAARARAIFHPYHDGDVARPWHVGVLYNRDARLAEPLLGLLRRQGDLVVGCNEPYAVSDATDFTVVERGERRGLPHVELELRQDLIADDAAELAWAARLAPLLTAAARDLPG